MKKLNITYRSGTTVTVEYDQNEEDLYQELTKHIIGNDSPVNCLVSIFFRAGQLGMIRVDQIDHMEIL